MTDCPDPPPGGCPPSLRRDEAQRRWWLARINSESPWVVFSERPILDDTDYEVVEVREVSRGSR